MTVRKDTIRSRPPSRNHDEQLKDEVYRQMFRLEAGRSGAELDLTIALLRAWLASDSDSGVCKSRQWLKKICPICLLMIKTRQQASNCDQPCSQ